MDGIDVILEIASIPAGLAVLIAFGIKALWNADDVLRDESKPIVSNVLNNILSAQPVVRWDSVFIAAFDRTFKTQNYIRPSLFRSLLASSVLYIIITLAFDLITGLSQPDSTYVIPEGWFLRDPEAIFQPDLDLIYLFVVLVLPINLVADFFSLWQTRAFMSLAEKSKKPYLFAIPDFIGSIIIFTLIAKAFYLIPFFEGAPIDSMTLPLLITGMPPLFFFAPMLTSLMTSVWLWMLILGRFAFWVASFSSPILRFLKIALPIEERPYRSMSILGGKT